jgi:hypothetical protein
MVPGRRRALVEIGKRERRPPGGRDDAGMAPTADDYAWFFEDDNCGLLAESYCCTLVLRLTPQDVLRRIDATAVRQADFEEVINPAEAFDLEAGKSYIAVTELAGCALILEDSSTVGYDHRVALSQGTTLVSHFQNVNVVTRFVYLRDGAGLLDFEPFYGDFRDISDSGLADAVREAGFVGNDLGKGYTERYGEAAFALADLLTGARLSYDALAASAYHYASTWQT